MPPLRPHLSPKRKGTNDINGSDRKDCSTSSTEWLAYPYENFPQKIFMEQGYVPGTVLPHIPGA